jgi:hypothetical protein
MANIDVKGSAANRAANVVYRLAISETPTTINAVKITFMDMYNILHLIKKN